MTSLYWIIEYLKVFVSYAFIMFIWPSVVFNKFLKGKSRTFFFSFCITVMVVILNTSIILMGLAHILNPWVFRVLFYGVFLFFLARNLKINRETGRKLKNTLTGTMGFKSFIRDQFIELGRAIRKLWNFVIGFMGENWFEYVLLLAMVIYGMIYFTYGAFQDYSFGFGDLYVHHSWIYGLLEGRVFADGVYPEAMHCVIYAAHVLFGTEIYSCLLFFAGIHSAIFLVSAYIFLKNILKWKYSPILVMALFLSLDALCIDEIYGMSRLQWTLPQEFGFPTVFFCAIFLDRYLKDAKRESFKHFFNENLLVFTLSLAASLSIHFYPTIMAFFACVMIIVPQLKKVFLNRKNFTQLCIAVLAGLIIAVTPMGIALLTGIPFQKSIDWAVAVIQGDDRQYERKDAPVLYTLGSADLSSDMGGGIASSLEGEEGVVSTYHHIRVIDPFISEGYSSLSLGEKFVKAKEILFMNIKDEYYASYNVLFGTERSIVILISVVIMLLYWIVFRIVEGRREKKGTAKLGKHYFDTYLVIVLLSATYTIMYNPTKIGLPSLIAGSRLCAIGRFFTEAVVIGTIDFIMFFVSRHVPKAVMGSLATCCIGGIYAYAVLSGNFHGFLYYELTRYNSAVLSTIAITSELDPKTYTIVATTDEIYQVIEDGFHEECISFSNSVKEQSYTIPTKYVFLYVEKHPIEYAQSHFFTGPAWLGCEKYPDFYSYMVSQCPDISHSEIYDIEDDEPLYSFGAQSNVNTNLTTRTILESQIYEWCGKFEEAYPGELKTYYEDDDFVCYYFEQNPRSLYELALFRGR